MVTKKQHRAVALAVAAALSVTSVVVLAAAAPASAGTLCGNGFRWVETKDVVTASKAKLGELRLYWNRSTKENCAVTMRTGAAYGHAGFTSVYLRSKQSKKDVKDESDTYSHYAGPVKLHAPGCIEAHAWVLSGSKRASADISGHCRP